MTMAPQRHPEEEPPISAKERAIPFAPTAEMAIAAGPDPSHEQPTADFRAARSEHRAAVPRLTRPRQPGRPAKSP